MIPICFIALILLQNGPTDAAKILAVFDIPSFSHQIVFQPIWVELVKRGHDVTVITPNILENNTYPNLRQIDIKWTYQILHEKLNFSDTRPKSWMQQMKEQHDCTRESTTEILKNSEVKKVLEEDFDLVFVQYFVPILTALGAKFKCPIVAITSLTPFNFMYEMMGNPVHPVLNPEYMTGLQGELNFVERVQSTLFSLWQKYFYESYIIPKSDEVVTKYIGENLPSLKEIQKNISFLFVNINPLISGSRPNVHNVIEFSGLHIQKPKKLPEDLKTFLDNSTEGVVYLSLGTNVKSALIPEASRQIMVEALSELPYKVLWKYESELLNKPDNIMTKNWIPQQDVLRHENVKVFITQGGSQSIEEAIYYQVPVVGIPIFSDQPRNIKIATKIGIGLGINIKTITKQEFKDTILEVINDKKYKNKVMEISDILKDNPMAPLDKIIWHIEYALRHNGAKHFRSPYADIPFWKYYFLDQLACLTIILNVLIFISIKMYQFTKVIVQENVKVKIKKH